MRFHEHNDGRTFEPAAQTNSAPGGSPGNLDRLRDAAQRFLEAGDAAINRALSTDSEQFVHSNRQAGGQ